MIHPKALVDDLASIGANTNVWAFAHVMAGARVGDYCNVGGHAFIESGAIVGNNVTLKNNVMVWDGIVIEDDVFVGPRVTFTNDKFPRSPRMSEVKGRYSERTNWLVGTVVRRGCTVGAAAIICPGFELGMYSMIAAGAVVTANVRPHSMVMGSPARHVSHVCSCGQKLSGCYLQTDCRICGETASARLLKQNDRMKCP